MGLRLKMCSHDDPKHVTSSYLAPYSLRCALKRQDGVVR